MSFFSETILRATRNLILVIEEATGEKGWVLGPS